MSHVLETNNTLTIAVKLPSIGQDLHIRKKSAASQLERHAQFHWPGPRPQTAKSKEGNTFMTRNAEASALQSTTLANG